MRSKDDQKEVKKKNKLIWVVIIFILGWFYWFQLRPTYIRKSCYSKATTNQGFYQNVYMYCMLEEGFPPSQIVAQ